MVISRRVDEYTSTCLELRATAIDAFVDGDFLVAAGCRYTTFISIGNPSISMYRFPLPRNIVRIVKCNSNHKHVWASASAQEIDINEYDEENNMIKTLASLSGHSRSVLDLSWNNFNANMIVSCSEGDSVNFWDIRATSKPVIELNIQFGASQSKFAPKMENIVCTTHGSDIRVWDIRKPNTPINQLVYFDGRIHTLEWHPKETHCFITAHNDGTIKIWDMGDLNRMSTAFTANARKIVFSPDAEEFATISLPSNNDAANSRSTVNIWRLNTFEHCQTVKIDDSDVIIDACWQNKAQKGVKYLFTLSRKGLKRRLYRHPIMYELMNEGRDEMPTPIAQSEVDVERDRLVMEPRINEQEAFELPDLVEDVADGPKNFPSLSRIHLPSESLPTSHISRLVSGGTTPLTISEWQRWITAPNLTGGDLLIELEALRKLNTEGLYTAEINFSRAAIGFLYRMHNKNTNFVIFSKKTFFFQKTPYRSKSKNGLLEKLFYFDNIRFLFFILNIDEI